MLWGEAGLGQTEGPDVLTPSGLLALQGGEAGPNLNPGINLSPGVVAPEVAGGIPTNVSVASMLGTTGSSGNTIMWVGLGVAVVTLVMLAGKGRRR